jgi:exosortase
MTPSDKEIGVYRDRAPGKEVPKLIALSFLLVCALPFALAWSSIGPLYKLVLENDTFSQIPLIPLVTLFLIYERRKAIFSEVSFSGILGSALLAPGLILLGIAHLNLWRLSATNPQSLLVFAIVLIWLGAFALFFGTRAFRVACFPLLFLLFMVPIPEPFLSKTIYLLQEGSSAMAAMFFRVAGVPYLRQGFVFQLPGVSIRVAEECSGIRSTLALLITTVLASYLFLRSSWRRLTLCIAVIPLAIFKNGLRIATLSTLAIYVNPDFLYGRLHHQGGIVFFMIALIPLALLLMLLQRGERVKPTAPSGVAENNLLNAKVADNNIKGELRR